MISVETFNPSEYGFESYSGATRKSSVSDYIALSKSRKDGSINVSISLSKESTDTIVDELGELIEPLYNRETGVFCIVKGNKKISKNRKGGRGAISINKLREPLMDMYGDFNRIYLDGSKFDNHPAFLFKPNGERD